MKKKLGIIFLLLCQCIFISANNVTTEHLKDHNQLRKLASELTDAFNKQEFNKLDKFFTKDFIFISIDQKIIKGENELKVFYNSALQNKAYGIKSMHFKVRADALTEFVGTNAGYCYGTADNIFVMKSGKTIHMESCWSATLTKVDGNWKIAMIHAGVNFVDNPLLNSIESLAKIIIICMSIVIIILIILSVFLLLKLKKKKQNS